MSRSKPTVKEIFKILEQESSALGVNDHHGTTIVNYMRFARYQRGQRLRAVDACFEELKDSRLNEDTFTIDEVEEMLDGLLAVVRGEVESELINTAHTNVLLLRQVFIQAEKWHLKLQADISELENRDLLEQIKDFEEMEFSGAKRDDFKLQRLEPVNEGGGSALLNMEIERLKEENEKLRERLKSVESTALNVSHEKSSLKDNLDRTRAELERAQRKKSGYSEEEIEDLQRQMQELKVAMRRSSELGEKEKGRLEGDLTSTKHELLKIRDMLDMAEKELEKKVSQTAPYKNLKSMMQKKNDQLKDLRRRLAKYEDPDD